MRVRQNYFTFRKNWAFCFRESATTIASQEKIMGERGERKEERKKKLKKWEKRKTALTIDSFANEAWN